VLNGFNAECSQADQCCTEPNEKNSKDGKYKIAADCALKNESMVNTEFKDTQCGKRENYESFVLPNRGAEFMKDEEDLEESRVEDRSNVRSGVDSDASGDVKRADGAEILYNPMQTALSQDEFQSSTRSRRPTHSMVRPSRFRDAAFETQFQPGRKKVRKVCFRPGRGDFRGCSSVDRVCDPCRNQRYCGG